MEIENQLSKYTILENTVVDSNLNLEELKNTLSKILEIETKIKEKK